MSEPNISPLARRLAEQNNVNWRQLTGTGDDGRIVERDVLDYLARVMAGEEALDPTPEPLPDGMQAWPDQDPGVSPAVQFGGATEQDMQAPAAEGAPAADYLAEVDAAEEFGADDLWGSPQEGTEIGDDGLPEEFTAPDHNEQVVPVEPAEPVEPADADFLPSDIFLLDDDDGPFAEPAEPAAEAVDALDTEDPAEAFLLQDDDGLLGVDELDEQVEPVAEEPFTEPTEAFVDAYTFPEEPAEHGEELVQDFADEYSALLEESVTTGEETAAREGFFEEAEPAAEVEPAATFGEPSDFGGLDDLDESLLVANDVTADHYEAPVEEDAPAEFDLPSELVGEADDQELGGLDPVLSDYSQDFVTPSEQLLGAEGSDWTSFASDDAETPEATDVFSDEGVVTPTGDLFEGASEPAWEPATGHPADLPDLWASDEEQEATPPPYEFGAVDADSSAAEGTLEEVREGTPEEYAEPAFEDEPEPVEEFTATDSSVEEYRYGEEDPLVAVPPAHFGDLPLARARTVIRRNVDLSALADSQVSVGLELGREEPLTPAPFLLRAVAKAASESDLISGQVAVAELGADLLFRRIDDAATRPFASLVEELEGSGMEEDEAGLLVVDLSAFELDEVLLDVDLPTVTLGRVLVGREGAERISTIALSGDLPVKEGAALLARVAELLAAPVRLLL